MKRILFFLIFFATLFFSNYSIIDAKNLNLEQTVKLYLDKDLGDSSIFFLSNLYDDCAFTLVEGESYYLIYDNNINCYVEYSQDCKSPYYNYCNYYKLYFGPANYFLSDIDTIYELPNLVEHDLSYIDDLIRLSNIYRELSENSDCFVYSSINNTYIDNAFYFQHLNNNIGSNTEDIHPNSCTFVACEMLLSYYDTFLNDAIIPDEIEYDNRFINCYADVTYEAAYYNDSLENFPESPGVTEDFHSYLINLAEELGYAYLWDYIYIENLVDVIYEYSNIINIGVTIDRASLHLDLNKFQFIKNNVDNDIPTLVVLLNCTYEDLDSTRTGNVGYHSVVCYGYNENGLIINIGWKGWGLTHIVINPFTILHTLSVSFNCDHQCSTHYKFVCSNSNCQRECDITCCGQKTYGEPLNIHNLFSQVIDTACHKCYCSYCGYSLIEEHIYEPIEHGDNCTFCDYTSHSHSFMYISKRDGRSHLKKCLCGYNETELCFGISNGVGQILCSKCGQRIG